MMIIKKHYLKSKPVCKVTFQVPPEIGNSASAANLVGEFNQWDIDATPMKKLKDGTFKVTVDLEKDREYRFRYLLDKVIWENAANADRYEPSPYGNEKNCVIIV
jgi:1,4-alpha-glucan branching enzyme